MKKTVLILVNSDIVVYNFRLELIEALLKENYNVAIVSPFGERIEKLKNIGCEFYELPMERHGTNPIKELKLLKEYKKLIKRLQPFVVLSYTIKCNIYGGIACRKLKIPYIANVTGLGDAIENGGLLQKLTLFLYKRGLKGAKKVFFQNEDNMRVFVNKKIVKDNYELLPGSGVSLERFPFINYPQNSDELRFLFVGRITKDKGVIELANVIPKIRESYKNVYFDVVGSVEMDNNPFENLEGTYYYGPQLNVIPYIKKCNAVVLPSYHEGMANVLLEGASSGRPILASNVAGCKETFDEGITGFGFEPKNEESLKNALIKFINLPYESKVEMGELARKKMEKQFDRQIVVKKYIDKIKSL